MATTTFLSNASVLIGAVDVSDQCSAVTLTVGYDSLETTAFGDTGHKYTQGLQNVSCTLTMFNSYGTSEIEATLAAIVGAGNTTLTIQPTPGAESASNPKYVISNAMMAQFDPISSQVGALSVANVTFTGGTFVRDITP